VKHTLVARVQDQPGVLNRVAGLFRRRAFNIASLTVGASEDREASRMTIVVEAPRVPIHLVEAHLRKLIPVLEVQDVTELPTVDRDLALVRVRCEESQRSDLAGLVSIFRGRVVDVARGSAIVEVTGDEDKVDGLVELLRPWGVLELARTGRVAMVRGRVAQPESKEEADGDGLLRR
jgi:acetolactate synthase I/III small subunit